MRKHLLIGLLAASAAIAGCKSKHDPDTAADNTARNDRDRSGKTMTADKAVTAPNDLDLTQQIRKAVYADDSLSTNAHNCKIVVQDGTVTLKGPVANTAESSKIEQLAVASAGSGHVVNQLEITN